MKYLTENFGIEEYKAPNIELTPLEYNFEVPYDLDSQGLQDDSIIYDVSDASEADLTEVVSRDYVDNSNVEYFDYFDYYHSKPTVAEQQAQSEVTEVEYIGNNLLDNTKHASDYLKDNLKDKINSISTGVAEGKQALEDKVSTIVTHGSNSLKDKVIKIKDNDIMQGSKPLVALDKVVHIIDDPFSNPTDRTIDVSYAPKSDLQSIQSIQSDKPKKATILTYPADRQTTGKSTW
jgi:hypothetical protein